MENLFISSVPTFLRAISSIQRLKRSKIASTIKTILSNLFSSLWRGVKTGVVRSRKHLKVFQSIVGSVVIYMVDGFIKIKFSSQKFFHNKTVLFNVFSPTFNTSIPIMNPSAFVIRMVRTRKIVNLTSIKNRTREFTMTLKGAILGCFNSIRKYIKSLSTYFTNNTFLSTFIIHY